MTQVPYVPDRGDLVWLNFSPQKGREQAGHRPALVLSARLYNSKTGLAIVCPITSSIKGYPFEVSLPNLSQVHGVVLADHVKNLDWRERQAEFKGKVPKAILSEVLSKIGILLGDV